MKVALIIDSMSLGGASRVMAILANHWAERGDEIVLITLDTIAADTFMLHSRVRRVALDLIADSPGLFAALANNRRRLVGLRRSVVASGADAVLSFGDTTNVMVTIATLGLGLRRVVCERTDVKRHRIGRFWPLLRRLTYPMAAGLVVQTRALLPWAESVMLGKNRVHVVPNPVPRERYTSVAARDGPPAIVSVGRLEPEKGYDLLLRAFARVTGDFPEWRLVIAGDGSQRATLESLVHELGISEKVRLAGYVAEPAEVLANGSLFIMPSRYEGFPNALLEAMAAGLPVISTASLGSLELISDGDTGVLVPVDSVEELAGAMRRLMGDRASRERLGRNGRAATLQYSVESIIGRWDALIEQRCQRSSS